MSKKEKIKELIQKHLKEISATGTGASFTAGAGENYATPNAFNPNKKAKGTAHNYYYKLGFKPVNRKALNEKAKGIEVKHLWEEEEPKFDIEGFISSLNTNDEELKNYIAGRLGDFDLLANKINELIYLHKMRNTLQEQYNLIKEGKGNKQQFFKSVRQLFPNLVTPINTFDDTVRILKNRGIITEGIGGVVTTGKKQDWHAIFNENMEKLKEKKDDEDEDDDDERYKKQIDQYEKQKQDIEKFGLQHLKHLKEDNEDKLNQAKKYYLSNPNYLELKDVAARFGVSVEDLTAFLSKSQDKAKSGDSTQAALQGIGLSEAKEAKVEEKETTKDVADMATRGYDYKDYKNIDNIFGETFLKGFYTEMQDPKNEDKTVEELKQIVAKNLAKDCLHYTKEGQFGIKGVGYTVDAPGLGETKPAKGKHKSSGYGDLKESVLRSQIHLLVKEVLAEGNLPQEVTDRINKGEKVDDIAKDFPKVNKKDIEKAYVKKWNPKFKANLKTSDKG